MNAKGHQKSKASTSPASEQTINKEVAEQIPAN